MGALVAGGGTMALFLTIMAWGLFVQGNSPRLLLFPVTLGVAIVTSGVVAVPYVLGSLVARVARRPYWIVGACAVVALLGLSFRTYVHLSDGGGQAFINMILHVAPYSVLVLAGWSASLWHSVFKTGGFGERQSPSMALAVAVTAAVLLGIGGSAAGYMLRDSPLWFKGGVPMVLVSLGLGLWSLRYAGQEDRQR
jgi:hypothetical protein